MHKGLISPLLISEGDHVSHDWKLKKLQAHGRVDNGAQKGIQYSNYVDGTCSNENLKLKTFKQHTIYIVLMIRLN